MSPESLRKTLDGINLESTHELEQEAYKARVRLITIARSYIIAVLMNDIDVMMTDEELPLNQKVLYTQLHSRHEETGVDAYGSSDTLSAHWKKKPAPISSIPSSEIIIHLPLTEAASKAYQEVLSSITAGVPRKQLDAELKIFFTALQDMEIDAINVHHIVHHPSGDMANIKHITPFGSIDYKAFSQGTLAEHKEEFELFLEHLPSSVHDAEEVLDGTVPEMHYITPDLETDINYINDLRKDLVNMVLVPQKQLS